MIALFATLGALVYLGAGAALARWAYGLHRAHTVDRYARLWNDPVERWRGSDGQFGAFWSALLAFLAAPVWVLTIGVILFVGGSARKSDWEKAQELKATRKRLDELERENERWRKVAGA